SCTGLVGPPSPALLTSVSSLPKALRPAATMRLTSASLAASPVKAIALPPALVISATVSSTSAPERAAHTTAAPSRANSWLITRPMPLLAPVMIATLPSSRLMAPPWERLSACCVRVHQVGSAELDRRDHRHPRAQHVRLGRQLVEQDLHRHALHDLHVVAGG